MIHHNLVTLLKAQGTKVYPNRAPDTASAPFMIYTQVSTPREVALDGPVGVAHATYRVDIYHTTYDAALTLSDAVRLSLNGYSGGDIQYIDLVQQQDLSDIDEEDPLYRVNLEFRITYNEAV